MLTPKKNQENFVSNFNGKRNRTGEERKRKKKEKKKRGRVLLLLSPLFGETVIRSKGEKYHCLLC